MTTFTLNETTVVMDLEPLAPRDYEKSQESQCGYDSKGNAYSYDVSASVYREETLIFPSISWSNLQQLISFIDATLDGSRRTFTWVDRSTISRFARYKDITHEPISNNYFKISLTLEVLI